MNKKVVGKFKFEAIEGIFTNFFDLLSNIFINVDPNRITILGFIFAVFAGIFFYINAYCLLLASFFTALNGIFDRIDGIIAKKSKRVTRKGDFLDHMLDRFSDILILLGISFSASCNTIVGLLATISVLLLSYTSTQGQAIGVKRIYGDLLGKEKRFWLLIIIPVIQFYLHITSRNKVFFNLTLLDFLMIWFIVAGIYTTLCRCLKIWKDLEE